MIKKGSSLGSQIAMETKGATDAGKGLLGITISVHSFGSGKVHVTFDMAGSNANMKDQYHEPIKYHQQTQDIPNQVYQV